MDNAGEGPSNKPLQDSSAKIQNPVEGPEKNYTVEYIGVTPHVRTGKPMITFLYQFKEEDYKIAQVTLDEFQASRTLKKEIKRLYGERGDEMLNEILNDPNLIRESKSKRRHFIPPSWKETGTCKKFKSIQAAVVECMRRQRLLPRVTRESEISWVPEGYIGDSNSPAAAERPPTRIYYGEAGELLRMLEEEKQADRDDAAEQGRAMRSDSDSEDSGLKDTGRGILPPIGVGGSREVGIQEAIDAVWNAENSEVAADTRRRALGFPPHPVGRESGAHGSILPEEMQAQQQISSGENSSDDSRGIPSQFKEGPNDYIDYDAALEIYARIPDRVKQEERDAYRARHGVTSSETAAKGKGKGKGKAKAQGLAPPAPGQHPAAGGFPHYRPMSPARSISEWHDDDLPLITDEQYRHIVDEVLEDEKPDHLKSREPRHPKVREYHRRLLEKADEREEVRREEERAEEEAVYKRTVERMNKLMSSRNWGYYEEGMEPEEESSSAYHPGGIPIPGRGSSGRARHPTDASRGSDERWLDDILDHILLSSFL